MTGAPRKLVTIIAESVLESAIVAEITRLPVSGYTIIDARGSGARGNRPADMPDSGNVRCEVVCKEPIAVQLAERLLTTYGQDYALVVYVGDVSIWRSEKF